MEGIKAQYHRFFWRNYIVIAFAPIINFKTVLLLPRPLLFKTFLVYAREIVLATQFSVTRFSVNRTGARVRNNSLLKRYSINELPISFSISSNRTFNVSMRKEKKKKRKLKARLWSTEERSRSILNLFLILEWKTLLCHFVLWKLFILILVALFV